MVKYFTSRAFVTDPKDVWDKETTIGLAEHAARLGSPSTFDRRGSVLVYDDFESAPLKWYTTLTGTGGLVTYSNEYPYKGSGCMKIVSPSGAGDYSRAYRFIGGIAKGLVGIEITVMFKTTVNCKPSISFQAYTGTKQILAGIRIEQSSTNGLSYLHDLYPYQDASWTSFNTDFTISTDIPYPIKFVVDIDNEKYVRCIFGGAEIDMSSYTPYVASSTYAQYILPEIYVVTSAQATMYFDNFILTIEEPP